MDQRQRFADELHAFSNQAQIAAGILATDGCASSRQIAQRLGWLVPMPADAAQRERLAEILRRFVAGYCSHVGRHAMPEPPGAARDPGELTSWFVRSLWAPTPSKNVWLAAVLGSIQTSYGTGRLPIDAIARSADLSTRYFRRLIHTWAGADVTTLLRWERLVRAQWHLSRSLTAIKIIAREVGYTSESQFDRDFKRECGVTPREFRQAAMTGNVARVTATALPALCRN